MKLLKSLALGSTAALVWMTGGATAADLPGAEPVDYVKVCDIKGSTGFFYIPGTETCLQIGGFVRLDFTSGEVVGNRDGISKTDNNNRTGYRLRTRLWFDARTDTEYGPLRTFIRLQFQRETGQANTTDRRARIWNADFNDDALFDQAFVQFAGLTAGVTDSFWDFKPSSTLVAPYNSDRTVPLIAYTFKFGDVSTSIALEDKTARYVNTANSVFNRGQSIPDIVANLRVKQGWGEAQIAGVAHRINPGDATRLNRPDFAGANSEWGWGVQGGVKLNLATANTSDAKGDYVWAQAAYTDGAGLSYNGFTDSVIGISQTQNIISNFQPLFDWVAVNGDVKRTKALNANLGVLHYWSPTWRSSLAANYIQVNYDNAVAASPTAASDWKAGMVMGNLIWSPVKKLDIGAEVAYLRNLKKADAGYTGGRDRDAWIGKMRVQRDF